MGKILNKNLEINFHLLRRQKGLQWKSFANTEGLEKMFALNDKYIAFGKSDTNLYNAGKH